MNTRNTDKAARVQAIRDGATVRHALGQAALHERLRDGRHRVILRGQVFIGGTLREAINAAKRGEQ